MFSFSKKKIQNKMRMIDKLEMSLLKLQGKKQASTEDMNQKAEAKEDDNDLMLKFKKTSVEYRW